MFLLLGDLGTFVIGDKSALFKRTYFQPQTPLASIGILVLACINRELVNVLHRYEH
jgi:hypothetical protein